MKMKGTLAVIFGLMLLLALSGPMELAANCCANASNCSIGCCSFAENTKCSGGSDYAACYGDGMTVMMMCMTAISIE